MNHYLSSHKSLFSVALSASLLSCLTSCQDEDFGYAKDQIAYETNFKKAFGEIPADQSWDLSSAAKWVDPLTINDAKGGTRAVQDATEDVKFTKKGTYSWVVPNDIFEWMQKRLIEGNDNRYLGSSFMLKVPNSDFAIIPIFQGNSAITSELEVKVNGFNLTRVWTKSEGMKATDTDNDDEAKQLGYYEGWSGYDKYYATTPNHPASTIKAKKVWTTPILFKKDELGAGNFMYLSLHNIAKLYNSNGTVWDSGNTWTTVGDRLTSINPDGQMLALDVDGSIKSSLSSQLPNIVDEPNPSEMMIIGCEDANGPESDHDNNDIVFLIVGYPSVPEVIPLTETIQKRYMCEDLGGTFDFDFNDIVVDVKQVTQYNITTRPAVSDWNFNDGSAVEIEGIDREHFTRTQTAKIAHVCGTLPIQAQVGNYLFPWISDPTDQSQTRTELLKGGWTFNGSSWVADASANDKTRGTQPKDGWNPNEEKTVTGWIPNENNIKIYVQWPKNWKSEPGHDVGVSSPTTGPGSADEYIYKVSNPYLDESLQAILVDFRDFNLDRLKEVTFPENGRVPYIIAVDPSVNWMQENECIDMDWLRLADHTKDHANESGVGSGGYYENPNSVPEVVIWQGSLTGEKWNHGLDFPVGTAEYNGIIDAFDGYAECNTLNIYFDKGYTDRRNDGKITDKTISLATHNPGWVRLTDTEADNYVAPRDVTPVTIDGKQCYRLQIKLTTEQIEAIRTGGLVVQLSSDNVMLHKISFTKESGFEINLTMPEHGKIETASRKRERYGDSANTGRVPFTHAAYVAGQSVELVAVPDDGYMFDGWENQSGTIVSTSVRYTVTGDANLRARFVEAQYIPVGCILQSSPYDSESYSDDYKIGNPIITVNDGKLYKFENGAYVPMSETTFTVNSGSSRVYVVKGTSVTFSVQKNSDYIYVSGTNFVPKETAYERTSDVVLVNGNAEYTPYVKFKEKKDPNFQISIDHNSITSLLGAATITWSSESDFSASDSYFGTIYIRYNDGEYNNEQHFNIWPNSGSAVGSGTLHVAPSYDCEKTVSFWIPATENFKSAKKTLTIKVENYRNADGFYVNLDENCATLGDDVNSYLNNSAKNKKIKFTVRRGTGMNTITIKSNNGGYNLPILWQDNGNQWSNSVTWLDENHTYFSFVMSASDWSNISSKNPLFFYGAYGTDQKKDFWVWASEAN